MSINKETLVKIAHLSRLEFDEREASKMLSDLNSMLMFVEKLQEIDTSKVEPLQSMSFEINQLRGDLVKSVISKQQSLKNAPSKDGDYFRVPKVIG